MSATLIGEWATGSKEWVEARRDGLGGSEIAAVMGLSPFESMFSLWYRKQGLIGPVAETPVMEWGNRLEDAVAQKFADEHPKLRVQRSGVWRNDKRRWQVGTPDRLIEGSSRSDKAVLEVKTARLDDGWGEEGTDEIPVHYRCQVLWYLDCLGLDTAFVAVLIGGSDYREYTVEMNQSARDDVAAMRKAAVEFLQSIDDDKRPNIDEHGQTYEAIKELHPDIDPVDVEIPEGLVGALIRTKVLLDDSKSQHQRAKSKLADAMGNAHYAYWNGVKIADRRARKTEGSTPYVQLANKLPALEEVVA